MNILLFGAPGAGKGTQSSNLVSRLDMVQISTGELLRDAIKNQSDLGIKAKTYMDKGELVPDALVVDLVESVLKGLDNRSFILDGFPRTLAQAQALEIMLTKNNIKINKAIYLSVPVSELVERLSGRRVCQNCSTVYHIVSMPSKKEGVCDKCNGLLIQRNDDKPESIKTRMELFNKNMEPLKVFYSEKGIFIDVDGVGNGESVYSRLSKYLT